MVCETHCKSRHTRCPKTRAFHARSHPGHVYGILSVCARRHVGSSTHNLGMHRVCTQTGAHMQNSPSYRLPTFFKNLYYRRGTSWGVKTISILPIVGPWRILKKPFNDHDSRYFVGSCMHAPSTPVHFATHLGAHCVFMPAPEHPMLL